MADKWKRKNTHRYSRKTPKTGLQSLPRDEKAAKLYEYLTKVSSKSVVASCEQITLKFVTEAFNHEFEHIMWNGRNLNMWWTDCIRESESNSSELNSSCEDGMPMLANDGSAGVGEHSLTGILPSGGSSVELGTTCMEDGAHINSMLCNVQYSKAPMSQSDTFGTSHSGGYINPASPGGLTKTGSGGRGLGMYLSEMVRSPGPLSIPGLVPHLSSGLYSRDRGPQPGLPPGDMMTGGDNQVQSKKEIINDRRGPDHTVPQRAALPVFDGKIEWLDWRSGQLGYLFVNNRPSCRPVDLEKENDKTVEESTNSHSDTTLCDQASWYRRTDAIKTMTFTELLGVTDDLEQVVIASLANLEISVNGGFFQMFSSSCHIQLVINAAPDATEEADSSDNQVDNCCLVVCNRCPVSISAYNVKKQKDGKCPDCRVIHLVTFPPGKLNSRWILLRHSKYVRFIIPSASLCRAEWELTAQFGWYCDLPIISEESSDLVIAGPSSDMVATTMESSIDKQIQISDSATKSIDLFDQTISTNIDPVPPVDTSRGERVGHMGSNPSLGGEILGPLKMDLSPAKERVGPLGSDPSWGGKRVGSGVDKDAERVKEGGSCRFKEDLLECLQAHHVDTTGLFTSVDFSSLSPAVNIIWSKPTTCRMSNDRKLGSHRLVELASVVPWIAPRSKKQSIYQTCRIGKNDAQRITSAIFDPLHTTSVGWSTSRTQKTKLKIVYPSIGKMDECLRGLSEENRNHLCSLFDCPVAAPSGRHINKQFRSRHVFAENMYNSPPGDCVLHHYNVACQFEFCEEYLEQNDTNAPASDARLLASNAKPPASGDKQRVSDTIQPVSDDKLPASDFLVKSDTIHTDQRDDTNFSLDQNRGETETGEPDKDKCTSYKDKENGGKTKSVVYIKEVQCMVSGAVDDSCGVVGYSCDMSEGIDVAKDILVDKQVIRDGGAASVAQESVSEQAVIVKEEKVKEGNEDEETGEKRCLDVGGEKVAVNGKEVIPERQENEAVQKVELKEDEGKGCEVGGGSECVSHVKDNKDFPPDESMVRSVAEGEALGEVAQAGNTGGDGRERGRGSEKGERWGGRREWEEGVMGGRGISGGMRNVLRHRNGWMVLGSQSLGAGAWGTARSRGGQGPLFEHYKYELGVGFFPFVKKNDNDEDVVNALDLTYFGLPFDTDKLDPYRVRDLPYTQIVKAAVEHTLQQAIQLTEKTGSSSSCSATVRCVGWVEDVQRNEYAYIREFRSDHPLYSVAEPYSSISLQPVVHAILFRSQLARLPAVDSIVEFTCFHENYKDKNTGIVGPRKSLSIAKVLNVFRSEDEALAYFYPQGLPTQPAQTSQQLNISVQHQAADYISPKDRHFIDTADEETFARVCNERCTGGIDQWNAAAKQHHKQPLPSIEPMSMTGDNEWLEGFVRRRCGGDLPPLVGPYSLPHLRGMLQTQYRSFNPAHDELNECIKTMKDKNRKHREEHQDENFHDWM